MVRKTKPIRWIKAARKDLEAFPAAARESVLNALTVVAEGGFPTTAKPMKGLGGGVYEIALPFRGDAFRAVYTLQFADALYVVHAFQKKSRSGRKTDLADIDLVRARLIRLKEALK